MKKLTILFCSLFCLMTVAVAVPSSEHVKHTGKHHTQKVVIAEHSVNINTAAADQLAKVKGIGKKKAAAIVSYREKNGNFKSVDDLTKIKGITPKKLAKFSNYLAV